MGGTTPPRGAGGRGPALSVSAATVIPEGLVVGGRVFLSSSRVFGTVRFVGETSFAPHFWAGLELDVPEGKNDGSVNGVRYFTCRPNHGLFVRPGVCLVLPQDGGGGGGGGGGSSLQFTSPSLRRTRSPQPTASHHAPTTQAPAAPSIAGSAVRHPSSSSGLPSMMLPTVGAGVAAAAAARRPSDDIMIELIVEVGATDARDGHDGLSGNRCFTHDQEGLGSHSLHPTAPFVCSSPTTPPYSA